MVGAWGRPRCRYVCVVAPSRVQVREFNPRPDPSEQSSQPGKNNLPHCLDLVAEQTCRPPIHDTEQDRTERNGCFAGLGGQAAGRRTDRSSRHLTWEQSRAKSPVRPGHGHRSPQAAITSLRIASAASKMSGTNEHDRPGPTGKRSPTSAPRPVTTACAGGNPVAAGGHVRHRRRTRVAPAGLPTCCGVAVPTCRATVILVGETEKPCRDGGSSCTHQVRSKSWVGFRLPAHQR